MLLLVLKGESNMNKRNESGLVGIGNAWYGTTKNGDDKISLSIDQDKLSSVLGSGQYLRVIALPNGFAEEDRAAGKENVADLKVYAALDDEVQKPARTVRSSGGTKGRASTRKLPFK